MFEEMCETFVTASFCRRTASYGACKLQHLHLEWNGTAKPGKFRESKKWKIPPEEPEKKAYFWLAQVESVPKTAIFKISFISFLSFVCNLLSASERRAQLDCSKNC